MIRDILESAMGAALTEEGAEEGIKFHSKILKLIKKRDTDNLKLVVSELFDKIEEDLDKEEAKAAEKGQGELKKEQ